EDPRAQARHARRRQHLQHGGLVPDQTVEIPASAGCNYAWCVVHLWIVPARVDGTYQTPQGSVTFSQKYQKLTGTIAGAPLTVSVRGEEIAFDSQGKSYKGRVSNGALELR